MRLPALEPAAYRLYCAHVYRRMSVCVRPCSNGALGGDGSGTLDGEARSAVIRSAAAARSGCGGAIGGVMASIGWQCDRSAAPASSSAQNDQRRDRRGGSALGSSRAAAARLTAAACDRRGGSALGGGALQTRSAAAQRRRARQWRLVIDAVAAHSAAAARLAAAAAAARSMAMARGALSGRGRAQRRSGRRGAIGVCRPAMRSTIDGGGALDAAAARSRIGGRGAVNRRVAVVFCQSGRPGRPPPQSAEGVRQRVSRGPAPSAPLRTMPCSAQVVERLPFEYSTFLGARHF